MDIVIVRDSFTAAKTVEGDVDTEGLLRGYEEIAVLYDSMGTVFHFASNEMRAHVKTIRALSKTNPDAYKAVGVALDHEKAQGIKGNNSASKTLMSIHWDIAFTNLVMQRLAECDDETKMSRLTRVAYDEVRAAHQSLPIRTAARLAMRTLPARKDFISNYIKQDSSEVLGLIPPTVRPMQEIQTIMEGAFIKHDLMKEAHAEAEKNRAEDAAQPPVE